MEHEFSGFGDHLPLFNTGIFANHVTEIEDACTTYFPSFVHIDTGDFGAIDRKYSLNTYATGNFTDSEGFGGSSTTALKYNTLELLFAFLVTLDDFIIDRDGVS